MRSFLVVLACALVSIVACSFKDAGEKCSPGDTVVQGCQACSCDAEGRNWVCAPHPCSHFGDGDAQADAEADAGAEAQADADADAQGDARSDAAD